MTPTNSLDVHSINSTLYLNFFLSMPKQKYEFTIYARSDNNSRDMPIFLRPAVTVQCDRCGHGLEIQKKKKLSRAWPHAAWPQRPERMRSDLSFFPPLFSSVFFSPSYSNRAQLQKKKILILLVHWIFGFIIQKKVL